MLIPAEHISVRYFAGAKILIPAEHMSVRYFAKAKIVVAPSKIYNVGIKIRSGFLSLRLLKTFSTCKYFDYQVLITPFVS